MIASAIITGGRAARFVPRRSPADRPKGDT
jgi:hypothetical protein